MVRAFQIECAVMVCVFQIECADEQNGRATKTALRFCCRAITPVTEDGDARSIPHAGIHTQVIARVALALSALLL